MNEIERSHDTKTWYFWTLTLLGKDHTGLKHSIDKWRDTWSKLRKRIIRDLGKLKFVRIFEMHKDGTLHVHMLTDKSYTDCYQVEATDTAKERTESVKLRQHLIDLDLGYIHDIKRIDTPKKEANGIARNVSAYIVKYMTKDIQSNVRSILKEHGSRLRIVQTSIGWFDKQPDDTVLDWSKSPVFKTEYLAMGQSEQVIDLAKDERITIDDFYDHDFYPNRTSDLVDQVDEN